MFSKYYYIGWFFYLNFLSGLIFSSRWFKIPELKLSQLFRFRLQDFIPQFMGWCRSEKKSPFSLKVQNKLKNSTVLKQTFLSLQSQVYILVLADKMLSLKLLKLLRQMMPQLYFHRKEHCLENHCLAIFLILISFKNVLRINAPCWIPSG